MRTFELLDTPLLATTYDALGQTCQDFARTDRAWAIDFANTQIVTMRKSEPRFRELTRDVDYFVPDGMPLIWCLNRRGAQLNDRVYGPIFMRRFLQTAPANSKHFLIGGSPECGRRLRERFPAANFVGGFHGRCDAAGKLDGASDAAVLAEIAERSPDYIWIGLGTPKQYGWLHRNKPLIARGVFLTVGFAFDVNAGTKRDAPLWMQRRGLTWLFRLASEPRRLLSRYLRYNSLFLYFLAKDALHKKH